MRNVSVTLLNNIPSNDLLFDCLTVEVLRGYLDQIDQIEDSVGKLEHAAFALDAYTIRLENKFKSLEKR